MIALKVDTNYEQMLYLHSLCKNIPFLRSIILDIDVCNSKSMFLKDFTSIYNHYSLTRIYNLLNRHQDYTHIRQEDVFEAYGILFLK